MKKPAQNEKSARPKRSAASRVQTYSLLQSGYYNEQRDLKRALKFSLIEAKAAQIKQKNLDAKKKDHLPVSKKVKDNQSDKLKDENKIKSNEPDVKVISNESDKLNNQSTDKQSSTPANDKSPISSERKFTAHRKFAQNCQPFSNTSGPVDFREKQKLVSNGKPTAVQLTTCPEVFASPKLTTDDFLTFLCFRDYVKVPFSLDKETNVDSDSTKETRKENSSNLEATNKERETFKENSKKIKLNGTTSKKAPIKEVKSNESANKLNSKINHKQFNKLGPTKLGTNNKLTQIKNQLKNSPSKVNQIKSNKLTKLAKLNKVKSIERKQVNDKSNSSLKKKPETKHAMIKSEIETATITKSTGESSSIESTIDEIIKQSVLMSDEKKSKVSTESKAILSKFVKPKLASKPAVPKISSKTLKKSKTSKVKAKEFVKVKKEEIKTKQQFMNTRNLRNHHHYQTKRN